MFSTHKYTKSDSLRLRENSTLSCTVKPLLHWTTSVKGVDRLYWCGYSISGAFWREGVRAVLTPPGAVQTNCLAQAFSICPSAAPLAVCTEHPFVIVLVPHHYRGARDVTAFFTSRCFISDT